MFSYIAAVALLAIPAGAASSEPPSICVAPEVAPTVIVEPLEATVDPDLVSRIIECESGWKEDAKNPNSSAKGLFQIIDGTWAYFGCTGDPLSGADNYRCGMKILEKNGTKDWDASKDCWNVQNNNTAL